MRSRLIAAVSFVAACTVTQDPTNKDVHVLFPMDATVDTKTKEQDDGEPTNLSAPGALVNHDLWTLVQAQNDPFQIPMDTISCNPGTYGVEGNYFEVETGKCNYITVEQPSLRSVKKGDTLKVTLWHLPLGETGAAEAFGAVQLANTLIWEQVIALPAQAKVYEETVIATDDAPVGVPVYFHVHNHGNNSWRLLSVEVL